jgi:hypothetical protein
MVVPRERKRGAEEAEKKEGRFLDRCFLRIQPAICLGDSDERGIDVPVTLMTTSLGSAVQERHGQGSDISIISFLLNSPC